MRSRLGANAARGVTVRTFHILGMAIIGDAEGKRPALARSAENDRALFDLLKGIVADLLADGALSETVLEWFQDQFAPYRSKHEFATWGAYWNYMRRNDIRSSNNNRETRAPSYFHHRAIRHGLVFATSRCGTECAARRTSRMSAFTTSGTHLRATR